MKMILNFSTFFRLRSYNWLESSKWGGKDVRNTGLWIYCHRHHHRSDPVGSRAHSCKYIWCLESFFFNFSVVSTFGNFLLFFSSRRGWIMSARACLAKHQNIISINFHQHVFPLLYSWLFSSTDTTFTKTWRPLTLITPCIVKQLRIKLDWRSRYRRLFIRAP
jgi:hypothetical protein